MQISYKRSTQREQEILKELRLAGGSCRIGYLAKRLAVSDETVRRNIKTLQGKSQVRKVHGGVVLNQSLTLTEQPFQARLDRNAIAKRLLAARLAAMIPDGESLFLDIGSTTAYVARALCNHRRLYIVTNSVAVASTLAMHNENRVFFAGGELRPHDGGSFGQDAINFIRRFTFKYAIFSAGAVDAKIGFMLHDIQEADLSSEAAARAQIRIILADSEKFGKRAPIAVSDQKKLDMLITETAPAEDIMHMLSRNEISLVLADSPDAKAS